MKYCTQLFLIAYSLLALSCSAEPLWKLYENDFRVGAAVGSKDIGHWYNFPMNDDSNVLKILVREFNTVTAENLMKWQYLQPMEGQFNFEQADKFMHMAEQKSLEVAGHVLVWHSQTPDWVFQDDKGNPASRDLLLKRMRSHIHTVVGRYKGRIKYWDVVNEAVVIKKGVGHYRASPWQKIIGDDYIELAFKFAHEADPEAILLYNDYSMTDKPKVKFVSKMVTDLRARDVPVHGIGMQGHWHLEYPSARELREAIDTLSESGASISITELDIGVLPLPHNYRGADVGNSLKLRKELDPYPDGVPEEILQSQATQYKKLFEVFLSRRDVIDRVTFWGVSDKYSWKNDFPMNGRTDYPLLFDREFSPKPAYQALRDLKR